MADFSITITPNGAQPSTIEGDNLTDLMRRATASANRYGITLREGGSAYTGTLVHNASGATMGTYRISTPTIRDAQDSLDRKLEGVSGKTLPTLERRLNRVRNSSQLRAKRTSNRYMWDVTDGGKRRYCVATPKMSSSAQMIKPNGSLDYEKFQVLRTSVSPPQELVSNGKAFRDAVDAVYNAMRQEKKR